MSYKVVVFDWDGTLVDSERHIVSSIEYAADKMSLPERSYDEMKGIIGLGMREALLTLYPELSEDEIKNLRAHYSTQFFSAPTNAAQLFDGVLELLQYLRDKGLKLAVATGKSRNGLEKALDSTTLRPYFDITRCADETRSKPDPLMLVQIADHFEVEPVEMLMVGDTEFDLAMAANLGVPSIAVSHGVHEVERLQLHKPLKVLDHLSELKEFV